MLSRQEKFGNGKKRRKEKEESDIHKGRDDEESHGAGSAEKAGRAKRDTGELNHGSSRPDRSTQVENHGSYNHRDYDHRDYDHREYGNRGNDRPYDRRNYGNLGNDRPYDHREYGNRGNDRRYDHRNRNYADWKDTAKYDSNRTGRDTGEMDDLKRNPNQDNGKREYNQNYHQEYKAEESGVKHKNIKRPEKQPVKKPIKKPAKTSKLNGPGKNGNTRRQTVRPTWVLGLIAIIILGLVGYLSVDNMLLRNDNVKLKTQLAKATESPDLNVDYGDLRYGSAGKTISPLHPEMVVEWREDPVYTPLEPTVYLTFDDGPSSVTPQILDILDAYGVKATFFVIGKTDEKLSSYYKEIVDRGHTLAMHSWTHQYNTIYESVDNFLDDYAKLYDWIYEKTGVKPELYRYPGGTTNSYANKKFGTFDLIQKEMDSRGFIYYDWNVSSGDAKGKNVPPEELIQNVVNGVKGKKYAVVLMHDSSTKETTATALPRMIEELAAMGYHFDRLTTDIAPIQFK